MLFGNVDHWSLMIIHVDFRDCIPESVVNDMNMLIMNCSQCPYILWLWDMTFSLILSSLLLINFQIRPRLCHSARVSPLLACTGGYPSVIPPRSRAIAIPAVNHRNPFASCQGSVEGFNQVGVELRLKITSFFQTGVFFRSTGGDRSSEKAVKYSEVCLSEGRIALKSNEMGLEGNRRG